MRWTAVRALGVLASLGVLATGAPTTSIGAAHAAGADPAAPARWAEITLTDTGYLYRAGLQDSGLTVRKVPEGLRFVDTGTASLRKLAPTCQEVPVPVGVSAVCAIPDDVGGDHPMLLEIHPRLGDDLIDTSRLGPSFNVSVLADAGDDTVLLGSGDDFVNGALGVDQVWGGRGDDWIRTGPGDDLIHGGRGDDRLVGAEDDDEVHGGVGDDEVGGTDGDDELYGDGGRDLLRCGSGTDVAHAGSGARATPDCEAVLVDQRR